MTPTPTETPQELGGPEIAAMDPLSKREARNEQPKGYTVTKDKFVAKKMEDDRAHACDYEKFLNFGRNLERTELELI
ncbi:hypothetical protein FSOLCH5_002011 [Fusarium solani]